VVYYALVLAGASEMLLEAVWALKNSFELVPTLGITK